MRWLLACVLLWTPMAWAAERCTTIDTATLSQDHASLIDEKAYWLAYNVGGQNQYPKRTEDTLCFADPTFNVKKVITLTTIKERFQIDEASSAADQADEVAADAALMQKLKALGLTDHDIQRLKNP